MSHDWIWHVRNHLLKGIVQQDVQRIVIEGADIESERAERLLRMALDETYYDWCRRYERDPDSGYTAADYENWFNEQGIET